MNQQKRLMIVAGGTGGHVFPGIVVAKYLMKQGWKVRWLGTANHIEANLVPQYNIDIDYITITGLRGKGIKDLLLAPIRILNACVQAYTIIKCFKPGLVLGMGGYVSGPGGLVAWFMGIPVVIHEQNSIAGLTNKWLAKIAYKVMQAFPGALSKAEVVGNPIHMNIKGIPHPRVRFAGRNGLLRILVVGGSQGACILNNIIPQVAAKIGQSVIIWHQSGMKAQQNVKQSYIDMGQPQHKVTGFINNMAIAYAWADIIICRSGALTVSEVAAIGLPALFVPFRHKDRQQYWNALLLKKVGAAEIIEESQFTADVVVGILAKWNRQILANMAQRARTIAVFDATERIAIELKLAIKVNIYNKNYFL